MPRLSFRENRFKADKEEYSQRLISIGIITSIQINTNTDKLKEY